MTLNRQGRPLRRGFTLTELIVAISIISILAALGVYFYPDYDVRQRISDGVDKISGTLLIAKQRAKRDGRPTGVRILNNGTELQYIQQPDDYAPEGTSCIQVNPSNGVLVFQGPTRFNSFVSLGDHIELYGGGLVRRIVHLEDFNENGVLDLGLGEDLNGNNALDATNDNMLRVVPVVGLPSGVQPTATPNYRIIRQARPIPGEQPVTLPSDIAIVSTNTNLQGIDLLFSPSGAVLQQANPYGQVYLQVDDTTNPGQDPRLIAIQMRTGYISSFPVYPDVNDPYRFTREARSSGL